MRCDSAGLSEQLPSFGRAMYVSVQLVTLRPSSTEEVAEA
jgi:hypothetical protein